MPVCSCLYLFVLYEMLFVVFFLNIFFKWIELCFFVCCLDGPKKFPEAVFGTIYFLNWQCLRANRKPQAVLQENQTETPECSSDFRSIHQSCCFLSLKDWLKVGFDGFLLHVIVKSIRAFQPVVLVSNDPTVGFSRWCEWGIRWSLRESLVHYYSLKKQPLT